MIVREGKQLNGFLEIGLTRREDESKLRAVVLNMVKYLRLSRCLDNEGGKIPWLLMGILMSEISP